VKKPQEGKGEKNMDSILTMSINFMVELRFFEGLDLEIENRFPIHLHHGVRNGVG